MTLRLDAGTAEAVAGAHDEAATTIDASAGSATGAVDAGYGAAHVADILSAVSGTAAEVAAINLGVAIMVRDAADDLGKSEAAIGREFDTMARLDE